MGNSILHKKAYSLEGVLKICMELRWEGYWSFRGQRDHSWLAEPHLKNYKEGDLWEKMRNFKSRCMEFPRPDYIEDTNSQYIKEWRWLFYAQHHRLKTQLLDWTSNPLVALYFAVEEIHSKTKNGNHGAVWALQVNKAAEKFKWEEGLNPINPHNYDDWLLIRPPVVTHRIARQSGLFTFHPKKHLNGSETFCKCDSEKRIVKISILQMKNKPNVSSEIRKKLGFLNIHHASLFPHPDGVANFINDELPDLSPPVEKFVVES